MTDTALLILCLVCFPLLWVVVCRLLGQIVGWHRLAERYPAPDGLSVKKRPLRTVLFDKWVRMVLTTGATWRGLYLAISPPFNMGFPALLIPWSAIRLGEEGWIWTELHIDHGPTLSLAKREVRELYALRKGGRQKPF